MPTKSCGDCDDNHQTDEHCGKPLAGGNTDPDGLCGHQHWTEVFGESQDRVCSTTESDAGCERHTTEYGGTWNDPDQHCAGPVGHDADRNCAALTTDTTCGIPSNPSTTSPDENCNATDEDQACSRYDRDESCGSGNPDEACGTIWVGSLWYTDSDENCSVDGDPDNRDSLTTCPQGGG